jgi:hypothetical protein
VRFAASTYAVGEGAPSIALSIERFAGSVGLVTVDYTTADGSAVAGADYTPASGTLRWSDGDSSRRTVQVSILNDAAVETAETVAVVLRNATGGVTIGAPALADVTITDDDRAASGGGGGGGGGATGLLALLGLLGLMALTWARRRAGWLFN